MAEATEWAMGMAGTVAMAGEEDLALGLLFAAAHRVEERLVELVEQLERLVDVKVRAHACAGYVQGAEHVMSGS